MVSNLPAIHEVDDGDTGYGTDEQHGSVKAWMVRIGLSNSVVGGIVSESELLADVNALFVDVGLLARRRSADHAVDIPAL